jgi:hypothetical protein
VTIDSKTGIISGVAPSTIGQYVITVCAYEYRNGVLINIHRKDVHVKVSDCIPLKAFLKPNYSYCDDFLVTFKNEQVNPTGSVYTWDFGDNTAPVTTTDIEGRVQHQYADTGTYKVKMNKKVKRLAMFSALSSKVAASEMIVVDAIAAAEFKTKVMADMLKAIGAEKKALVVLAEKNEMVIKSLGNIAGVKIAYVNTLNVYDILNCGTLVVAEAAAKKIEEVYA